MFQKSKTTNKVYTYAQIKSDEHEIESGPPVFSCIHFKFQKLNQISF